MKEPLDPSPAVVLAIGGHDPTGGAGILADAEAVAALGGHAVTLITALTAQDTHGASEWQATDPGALTRQGRRLLADVPVQACKLGLLPTPETATAILELLVSRPRLPLVLDPVLASGRGDPLAQEDMAQALSPLLERVTVLTPNTVETRRLGGSEVLEEAASRLSRSGPDWLLVTGAHEAGSEVENQVWRHGRPVASRTWPRLPHGYHGSGCTLASAVAALLARGVPPLEAMEGAQAFTWESLRRARSIGGGQRVPHRLYALHDQA